MSISNLFNFGLGTTFNQERLTDASWEGATVISMTGKLSEMYQAVPLFSRHPFRSGGEENRYKDEIRREPLKVDENQIPVATVPTDNLFHASQALSWIAGTRKSVQERTQYVTQIPALMEPLVESTR
jgi:hypothetical protein